MTNQEIIKVVQGADNGEQIQFESSPLAGDWADIDKPLWNFEEIRYRVKPKKKYRTPTDEDAKNRPIVEVRNYDGDEWVSVPALLFVSNDIPPAFLCMNEIGFYRSWKQARIEVK